MSELNRDRQTVKKPALGKGFQDLLGLSELGDDNSKTTSSEPSVLSLPIEFVRPNPEQPRRVFRETELEELSQSIARDGIIQPIIVSKESDKSYMIIAGERRWRGANKAGLTSVPCIVRETTASERLRLALIENIQRQDLNPIEEAEAFQTLIDQHGLTQEKCGEVVGRDRTTVTNTLRLLLLPTEIQQDILDQRLSMGHGRALLSLEDKKIMLRVKDMVLKKQLSVRQTELLCKRTKTTKDGMTDKPEIKDENLAYIADAIRNHLQTKIKFSGGSNKGKIEISYFSTAELERILQILGIEL